MSLIHSRRIRRRPASRDIAVFKKDQAEPKFFGEPGHEPFFKPVAGAAIQRKAANSLVVDKVLRTTDKSEEETVQRMPAVKEEEKLQRATADKEDDTVQRMPEQKEEEKVQRAADDKEEEKVERMPEQKEEAIQRAEAEKEDETVQAKEAPAQQTKSDTAVTSNYIAAINGKGNPLPAQSNNFFTNKMGYDFSDVKIHTGKEAGESASNINAKAYTIRNHIVFNEGQYNTESSEGKKLLAHELTHVVQQDSTEKMVKAKKMVQQTSEPKVQRGFWGKVWSGVKSVGGAIKTGAKAVGGAIKTGAKAVWGGVKKVGRWGWDVLKSAGAWVWDFVTWAPQRVWSMLKHVGSGIVGVLGWLWNGFSGALGHIWDGVKGLFSWAGQGIEGLFNWIWAGIRGGASWAYQLLQGNFSGFWAGFADAFSWLGSGVKGLFAWGWRGVEGLVMWLWGGAKGIAKWAWKGLLGGLAWVGRLIAKMLDLVGFGEIWTLAMNIIKFWCTRTLTGVEEAEARKVFGGSISYWQVRIDEQSLIAAIGSFFSGGGGMGVTTAHTINFNHSISAAAGNSDMAWLIHELSHVAQYTHVGLQYIGEAIHAQATGGYSYNEADLAAKNLADFNREQQADIIKNYYNKVLYGSTPYAVDYTKMRNQAISGRF
jgi:outer membrane biosynthesis protein TonB